MKPKISIIVLNWNGWPYTISCLDSILLSSYKNYEIILIDNGSDPISLQEIHAWLNAKTLTHAQPSKIYEYKTNNLSTNQNTEVRLAGSLTIIRSEENLGFAGGCNLGMTYAFRDNTVKYILLLNNDMKIHKDMLEQLIIATAKNPSLGGCQPKIVLSRKSNYIDAVGIALSWCGFPKQIGNNETDKGQYAHTKEIMGISGGAALLKREMLEDIGFFDEDFFAYYEDVDLCLRAKKAAWKMFYIPDAVVYHFHSASLGEFSPQKFYFLVRNTIFYVIKNFTIPSIILFMLFSYPLLVIISIHKTGWKTDSFKYIFKGVKDGLLKISYFWKKRRRDNS